MKHPVRALFGILLAAGLLAVPVAASDPMGVYCIVDKVVYEPTDCPERAQVWGACALASTRDWRFDAASKGYFYYSIPTGQESVVRAEWTDIRSVAGTGQVVGFGRRYYPVGRFRVAGDKPGSPDPHPIHMGVLKLGPSIPSHLRELADALKIAARR